MRVYVIQPLNYDKEIKVNSANCSTFVILKKRRVPWDVPDFISLENGSDIFHLPSSVPCGEQGWRSG